MCGLRCAIAGYRVLPCTQYTKSYGFALSPWKVSHTGGWSVWSSAAWSCGELSSCGPTYAIRPIGRTKNNKKQMRNAIPHRRCTRRKCSTLSQRLLRHAHSLPFAPRTNTMTTLTTGIRARSAIQVPLNMPQSQVKPKAPQFQRRISGGTTDAAPSPEVLFIREDGAARPTVLDDMVEEAPAGVT